VAVFVYQLTASFPKEGLYGLIFTLKGSPSDYISVYFKIDLTIFHYYE